MGWHDHYDHEDLVKWHHFAFRADSDATSALRSALEQWVTWRERGPLDDFRRKRHDDWQQRLVRATVSPPRKDIDALAADWCARGGEFGMTKDRVRAAVAALGSPPTLPRLAWNRAKAFPLRMARLARLRELSAPAEIVSHEVAVIVAGLEHLAAFDEPEPLGALDESGDSSSSFDASALIDLAIADPWAEDVGYGRLYGALELSPPPSGRSLVDPEWPVHCDNLDAPSFIYGFDGFPPGVVDKEAAERALAALSSGDSGVDADAIELFTLQRLQRALERSGAWREPPDPQDDDDDDSAFEDFDRHRARHAGAILGVAAVDAERERVLDELEQRDTALADALGDVAAGRCVLLQWDAKNPAL